MGKIEDAMSNIKYEIPFENGSLYAMCFDGFYTIRMLGIELLRLRKGKLVYFDNRFHSADVSNLQDAIIDKFEIDIPKKRSELIIKKFKTVIFADERGKRK